MTTLLIVIGVLAAASAIAWFLFNRQNPENMASHGERTPETTAEQLYGGADRPAGPDATTMDPDALGGDHRPPEA